MTASLPALIVGIDPGTTAAFGLLGLDGTLLASEEAKHLSLSDFIERILVYGTPVVFACDKQKAPATVRKICAQFGAHLVSPPQDLTQQEKKNLVATMHFSVSGHHAFDAVASASFAYQQLKPLLRRVFLRVSDSSLYGSVLRTVLKTQCSIEAALQLLTQPEPERTAVERVFSQPLHNHAATVRKLLEERARVERELSFVKEERTKLSKRLGDLRKKTASAPFSASSTPSQQNSFKENSTERRLLHITHDRDKLRREVRVLKKQLAAFHSALLLDSELVLLPYFERLDRKACATRGWIVVSSPHEFSATGITSLVANGVFCFETPKRSLAVKLSVPLVVLPRHVRVGDLVALSRTDFLATTRQTDVFSTLVKKYQESRRGKGL